MFYMGIRDSNRYDVTGQWQVTREGLTERHYDFLESLILVVVTDGNTTTLLNPPSTFKILCPQKPHQYGVAFCFMDRGAVVRG